MRQTLQTLFGSDLSTAQKVIIASVVILILLVLLGLFVRQIKGGRLRMKGQGGGRQRQPRLGVVDAHDLDRQRQLILIRRDNVEHLIMIGGVSDIVIETNIVRSGQARTAVSQPTDYALTERPAAFDTLVPPEPLRQEPMRQEPMRQEPPRQEPVRQEPVRQEPTRQEPVRQEPVAIAQPRPELLPPLPMRHAPATPPSRPVQSQTQAEAAMAAVAAAIPAGLAVGAAVSPSSPPSAPAQTPAPTPSVQPPSFARDYATSPTASAVELDSMAKQLEEALKRPFSAVRPANSPGERPSEPVVQAPDVVPARERAAEPAPVVAEASPLPMPTPPAPPETTGRPVALPVDVEAELELALGLKPGRANPLPPHFGVGRTHFVPEPVEEPEATASEFAHEVKLPESEPEEAAEDLVEDTAPEPKAGKADHKHTPEPEAEKPDHDAPSKAEAAEAAKPPVTEAEPQKEPEKKPAAIDPFSVDAIEAEFARLLGRDPKSKS